MDWIEVTAPAIEPVSVATLKSHLRVDSSTEDTLIGSYLKSARIQCEGLARRAFITQKLALLLDDWPAESVLTFPRPPLQNVTAFTWKDQDGGSNAFSDYVLDVNTTPGRLTLATGKAWPSGTLFPIGAIRVEFLCGYGDAESNVPEVFKQAILLLAAFWYENRMAVADGGLEIVPLGVKTLLDSDRGSYF